MKKRLAKKAVSPDYFDTWIQPKTGAEFPVIRNGRCWNIYQRACAYYGHPEWPEELIKHTLEVAEIGDGQDNDTEDK